VIGGASLALFYLFGTCGAGAVYVANQGWLALFPVFGCGALIGAVLGAIFAPAEYASAKIFHFILEIAFLAPALTVSGILMVLWLLGKL
jgi:hypothetical protein